MGPVDTVRRVLGTRPFDVRILEPQDAAFGVPKSPIHAKLGEKLELAGIKRLYQHQTQAFDATFEGKDIIVVTGTSSGKSLCYNLPVIDTCLREPVARALYLFPTKALAQDQAGKLQELLPDGILCGTYDGDTSTASRSAVRKNAHIVLTNPDMLHVGILPNQENWHKFFKSLRYIVIDEAHTYRGVFGSHVAGVLRRLLRLCAWQNNRPQLIACSATIANPVEMFEKLTGRTPSLIDNDTAPKSRRAIVLVQPPEGVDDFNTNKDVAELLSEFVSNNVRTLAFCRSRVTTELVVRQARSTLVKTKGDPAWVDSYRGGYTPKERRQIEQALFKGKLRGLATTNAMELGVDIGGLDAVLLNGYPGSISSFWQQVGRAGRGTRDGLSVMIAQLDPLEQYLVRFPELLLDKPVESVTLNPTNPHVLESQLRCAAYERPIGEDELETFGANARSVAGQMVESGDTVWQSGRLYYPSYQNPALKVNIRGTGGDSILLLVEGQPLGEMEYWRALRFAHEGAVYLHRGQTYIVQDLDLERKIATLVDDEPPYYTIAQVQNLVERTVELQKVGETSLCGVRVTSTIHGYLKHSFGGQELMGEELLDLPVQTFDTVGCRIDLPDLTFEEAGSVHAVEHALLAVAPLIAGCDRNDLGSCWFVMCPDSLAPAVYIYDQTPGGIGLSEKLFEERTIWFNQALALLESCPCVEGCPSCLWNSKCGNSVLDKQGAIVWLREHVGQTNAALAASIE